MHSSFDISCPVEILSVDRAKQLVPVEYVQSWEWFIAQEGSTINRLPFGGGTPEGFSHPLSGQRGIYHIGKVHLGYDCPYVLSVSSQGKLRYDDGDALLRADGTWTLDYSEHIGTTTAVNHQGYNERLMNCLYDGIPVGIMVKSKPGYHVLGLAFVERYNSIDGTFTLHGPASGGLLDIQHYTSFSLSTIRDKDLKPLLEYDSRSELYFSTARSNRRIQTKLFNSLVTAYDGRCAITGTHVIQTLKIAKLDPYRTNRTPTVNTSILMRADLMHLYESHLFALEPAGNTTCKIRLGKELLKDSQYRQYDESTVILPNNPEQRPNRTLIKQHFQHFKTLQRM